MEDNKPCPKCGHKYATDVEHTWAFGQWWSGKRWDIFGLTAPKRFNLVRCRNCGTIYNGKTGKQETKKVIIWILIPVIITILLVVLIVYMWREFG